MAANMSKTDSNTVNEQNADIPRESGSKKSASSPSALLPSISAPRGGGAIRGIGEKFAANPVTGTASLTVPIATSAGRSGFGPQLSLSYDSGAGNGPFGYGWSLSLPAITRKTDKGLPQYRDLQDSDVFILSGAEDLVPVLKPDSSRFEDTATAPGYTIHRFRPRVDALFACIERWTSNEGDCHWRSISKDNILTVYGKNEESRIVDPDNPQRIFCWLICEIRDDKGNAVVYEYKREDGLKVDLTEPHERNRGDRDDHRRKTNRHVKHIRYGNRVPFLDDSGQRPHLLSKESIESAGWLFEVVFDYGEHDPSAPKPNDTGDWLCRHDPFSSYRSGFEVRNYRLCQRILMFHHFAEEENVGVDCLVRSMDFVYRSIRNNPDDFQRGHPICSLAASVKQSGYKRLTGGGYIRKSLPPLELEYSQALLQNEVRDVDATSLENLPVGLGKDYDWVDLDGESMPGILTDQNGTWMYKANLSPYPPGMAEKPNQKAEVCFGAGMVVPTKPTVGLSDSAGTQLLDLTGNGHLDLVQMQGPCYGYFERTEDGSWESFREFQSWPNLNFKDPNQRFVDLTGDGHADILVTEDRALVWYASLAERGFGPQFRQSLLPDEERGPRFLFSDETQSVYLCDMSGDGMADLVRLRNGEICYWPNCGFGCFGAKVTMNNTPHFDYPDQFDQRRIRLADIDGSGTCDLVYLGSKQVDIYFNQSGNGWSTRQPLATSFPATDNLSSVQVVDLLGNGTACLVWSSVLPGDSGRQMRYINLIGEQKPHLLIQAANNMGMETRMQYAPSTKFYAKDRGAGTPWVTKLPFVVHVLERVETFDLVGRNHFVSQYKYHHGYFDCNEREFRGFGMVEQIDSELFGAFPSNGSTDVLLIDVNEVESSQVPPMLTRTWFHVGAFKAQSGISSHFEHEYYREGKTNAGGLGDEQLRGMLLADTVFPTAMHLADGTFTPHSLTTDEMREACRSLKGSMLRQEIFALDGSPNAAHPYTVAEHSFTIDLLQPLGNDNRHAVFATHPREQVDLHYERKLTWVSGKMRADPRVNHSMAFDVDAWGNVLRSMAIAYRRRALPGVEVLEEQLQTHFTLTVARYANRPAEADWYRVGLPIESRTYEIVKPPDPGITDTRVDLFTLQEMETLTRTLFPMQQDQPDATKLWPYGKWDWRRNTADAPPDTRLRLIEHIRTLYRKDNLSASLPLGQIESLALPLENYKLAFTPELASALLVDSGRLTAAELDAVLLNEGQYVHIEGDKNWWLPSGRLFYSPNATDNPQQEATYARQHWFLALRYRNPFHTDTVSTEISVHYDAYDLLVRETLDAVGNRITAGARDSAGHLDPTEPGNDYRVLQPKLITDANRNHTEIVFDALGMVVGTAVKGKDDSEGDLLSSFEADLSQIQLDNFFGAADPHVPAPGLLKNATTRVLYDFDRFSLTRQSHPDDSTQWLPVCSCILARETHASNPLPQRGLQISATFSYSDGSGREIQKKMQSEPGPVVENGPIVNPRWVATGWTIFNNKGKPVRQYEPYFSQLPVTVGGHHFEFGIRAGVSPVLFYDPAERVVATLHPNNTYEKLVFDSWQQRAFDTSDTVSPDSVETGDPRTDADISGYMTGYFKGQPGTWQTWYQQRVDGAKGTLEQNAATKAAQHTNTPTTAYLDTLGRTFLTVAHNKTKYSDAPAGQPATDELYNTRTVLDIEGNQRDVVDAKNRIIVRHNYDMLGNIVNKVSMEAGEKWILNDVTGKPIRAWDSRGHVFRTEYDPLRRPLRSYVKGTDPARPNQELLTERLVYGEKLPNAELSNLRSQIYMHLDQAGAAINKLYDFKGNLLHDSRQLTREYKQATDWTSANATIRADSNTDLVDLTALEASLRLQLEEEVFDGYTSYDALNRTVQLIAPRSNKPGAKRNVTQPVYNEAGLLEQMHVWLDYPSTPGGLLDPSVVPSSLAGVSNIDYNAKGQRLQVFYKNGANIRYRYDPETFRVTQIYTRRGPTFTEDCGGDPPNVRFPSPDVPPQATPCGLQNLNFTYDAKGNITYVRDDSQQSIYFRNRRVDPNADYTYDAMCRLIEATGREHLGQVGNQPNAPTAPDAFGRSHTSLDHPNDSKAMGTYLEQYFYDAVGNFQVVKHIGTGPSDPGWVRRYQYNETSLIEDGTQGTLPKTSNRLSSTTVGSNNPVTEQYAHDSHGNFIKMPHLGLSGNPQAPNMHWDYKDQLQQVDRGGGGTAYYVYDAAGARTRKVWEKAPGLVEERIYLTGFEVFRRRNGSGEITFERETLHVLDGEKRLALVESRNLDTAGTDAAPQQLIRYQFTNDLDSSCLELDDQALIISYEEYTPYGNTSYQAVRGQRETPKRYRFTGKERDEESGLCYHGVRYYAPWLGRWTSCDPLGLGDGPNIYAYVQGNPIRTIDKDGKQGTPSQPDRVEDLASLFSSSKLDGEEASADTVSQRLQKVLDATEHWLVPGLKTGGLVSGWHDEGYNVKEFKDPWESSNNQSGHFLTAVNLGASPDFVDKYSSIITSTFDMMNGAAYSEGGMLFQPPPPRFHTIRDVLEAPASMSATELAIRVIVGHEKVADSRNPLNFITQYKAATAQDVAVFQRAAAALGTGPKLDLAAAKSILIGDKKDKSNPGIAVGKGKGNSMQDLLLSLVGWKLGQDIAAGKFKSRQEVATFLKTNLK